MLAMAPPSVKMNNPLSSTRLESNFSWVNIYTVCNIKWAVPYSLHSLGAAVAVSWQGSHYVVRHCLHSIVCPCSIHINAERQARKQHVPLLKSLNHWPSKLRVDALTVITSHLYEQGTRAVHGCEPKISKKKCFEKFYENSQTLENTCTDPKSCTENLVESVPKLWE